MKLWQNVLVAIAVLLAGLGLLYRKTLYGRIRVAPGDPYGLGVLVVAGAALAILGGVVTMVVPRCRSARNAVVLVGIGIGSVLLYFWLHPMM